MRTFFLIALTVLYSGACAAVQELAVVLANTPQAPGKAFVSALRKQLPAGVQVREVVLGEVADPRTALAEAQWVIALGAAAVEALAGRVTQPVLVVMVSRARAAELQTLAGARHFAFLVLDQPLARQMALIREALPQARSVGVLLGPDSGAQMPDALGHAAGAVALSLHVETVPNREALLPLLERLLAGSEVVLAMPDALLYNSLTVRPVLLTTYRARRVLFGYSESYVGAGALAAVFSAPEDIATDAARWLAGVRAGRLEEGIVFATAFSVAVNQQVARSLGLSLPEAGTLRQALVAREVR